MREVEPPPAAPRVRPVRLLLKLLVSAALLGVLFSRVPFGEVLALFARGNLALVLLALLLFLASIVGSAFQWGLFLSAQGIRLPLAKRLDFYLVGLFFNNFLPANLGGDVVKVVHVAREGGSRGGAVVATLMDRAVGLLVLLAAGTGAAWVMGDRLPFPEFREPLYLATAAVLLAFATVFSRRLLRLAAGIAERIPWAPLAALGRRLLEHLARFQADRRAFLVSLAVSAGIQALRIGVHYVCALALGVSLSPLLFVLVVPAIAIAVTLPISLGGFGIREGLGVLLFGRVGVGAREALAFELLSHIVAVAVSAAGGILFALRRRGR